MITVKEIAKMCGVSASTVSNILNGKPNVSALTRQRILDVIKETGYQPNYFAASMRKRNTRMVSIIAEDMSQFSTMPIVEALMECFEKQGYRTVLMNLRLYGRWHDTWFDDENKQESILVPVLQEVQSIKVDGVVYVAGHCRTIKSFPQGYTLPTLIAYATSEGNAFPSITIDDEKGGYDMTKYLISMGHRKIGIVAGEASNIHTKNRLLGHQRALFEAEIPYNPAWTTYGDWMRQSGHDCAAQLEGSGVTAIWCMNDLMAAGVYDYTYEHGLVIGKDISVAGYDNMQIADYMYPKLTTNELPLKGIGRRAAEILIQMLGGESEDSYEPIKLPCTMKIRDSVRDIISH